MRIIHLLVIGALVFAAAYVYRIKMESTAWLEHTLGSVERQVQFVELFVDEDTQRLEGAGCRVNVTRSRFHRARDHISERARSRDWRLLAGGDNGASDAARMPLFPKDVDDVGEFLLGGVRDDICRRRSRMPHSHVQGAIQTEREAPAGLIELHRRDANVHDNAVDRRAALIGADVGEP